VDNCHGCIYSSFYKKILEARIQTIIWNDLGWDCVAPVPVEHPLVICQLVTLKITKC